MPGELSRAAAIVGAAEANEIGYPETPKTALQLHRKANEGKIRAEMKVAAKELEAHISLADKRVDKLMQ